LDLRYIPPGFLVGLALGVVCLLVVSGLLVASRFPRWRRV
jgi:hypothetical protein